MTQSAFFGFPDNKESFEIINHLHLIFKYYLFKVWDTRKVSLEGLKKNIKIYKLRNRYVSTTQKKKQSLRKWYILENLIR